MSLFDEIHRNRSDEEKAVHRKVNEHVLICHTEACRVVGSCSRCRTLALEMDAVGGPTCVSCRKVMTDRDAGGEKPRRLARLEHSECQVCRSKDDGKPVRALSELMQI